MTSVHLDDFPTGLEYKECEEALTLTITLLLFHCRKLLRIFSGPLICFGVWIELAAAKKPKHPWDPFSCFRPAQKLTRVEV